ncbi:MAG: polyphosphate:AMP phosphotransferase, partial [Planctomycetes bacterium]|nr:polyphosphate:AMP phosphotransferase [Planctomycetota bacterium]
MTDRDHSVFDDLAPLPELSDDDRDAQETALRTRLLAVQTQLAESDRGLVIVLSGVEGGGKTEVLHRLYEWMDARGLEVHALHQADDDGPLMKRYWQRLPARGRIA